MAHWIFHYLCCWSINLSISISTVYAVSYLKHITLMEKPCFELITLICQVPKKYCFSLHWVFLMNVTEWRYWCIFIRLRMITISDAFLITFLVIKWLTRFVTNTMCTSFWTISWNITIRLRILPETLSTLVCTIFYIICSWGLNLKQFETSRTS